ncbi:DUF3349 domain-containing protein [Mycolicibacterium sp.]|jgi:hypothetical protein|uniref:DUF3349 domain-containing protein n=1 Tax=Mycolicibacterium sp. TaxID=2320850 RepID=UPI0028B18E26|nr:DUF3349 domain-containing protein [Mycolicibacterium sp.]
MVGKSLVSSIVDWLRAGYPGGVPGPDRVPLLALLATTPLTDDEIRDVVRLLTAEDSPALADNVIDRDEIEEFIEGVTHHSAGPEDIRRIADKLAAAGWAVADVDRLPPQSE